MASNYRYVGQNVNDDIYIFTSVYRYAGQMLEDDIYNRRDIVDNRALQALAAGLKAYSTWESVHGLQTCRECTGGMVSLDLFQY